MSDILFMFTVWRPMDSFLCPSISSGLSCVSLSLNVAVGSLRTNCLLTVCSCHSPCHSLCVQVQRWPLSTGPVPAARLPCRVKLSAGKRYAWCACGHSKKQPFCDGAHRTAAPSFSPLRFTPDKDRTVMLCACKQTKNAPYCDGSHFKVILQDLVKRMKGVFK
ncbi:putative CDGSH iron-sulfur domain-containing protein 3 mitochondrial-like [Scophthalmus maximus]|uniref:Putative CDGSH iron-sulfur domain-containing protein 3 mitochondrial-like n=1 Tax=Scophthalmus maximus TaxID=52904 RepID=A0A2U9BQD4_SCOMX|nr:putative CDGSH iron-sulfur domain-containing protein 3 mitochondrial-like [Scophthalmus maximus]